MNDEWMPVLVDDPAPPEPDSAVLARVVGRGRKRLLRRRAIFGASAAAIAVLLGGSVAVANHDDRTRIHIETPTTSRASVADQTRRLSHILFADLPGGYGTTSIDTSKAGVITIGLFAGNRPMLPYEAQLAGAGTDSGLWSAADAARMVRTRDQDGIVRSENGKTTWTYHKDGDLHIVARVP